MLREGEGRTGPLCSEGQLLLVTLITIQRKIHTSVEENLALRFF